MPTSTWTSVETPAGFCPQDRGLGAEREKRKKKKKETPGLIVPGKGSDARSTDTPAFAQQYFKIQYSHWLELPTLGHQLR